MKESIYISHLGPIKSISIEELKPVTVLIGESGSGKSTLMKTISLFRWIYKMYNIRSYLKRSGMSKSPFRFKMETYLKSSGLDQFVKPDKTEITYCVEFDERKYTILFKNNKLSMFSNINEELIQDIDLYFNKISFISETRNIIPLWADRGASLAGGYLGFHFHEVYQDFEIASETLKELAVPYLDLKFVVKKNKRQS